MMRLLLLALGLACACAAPAAAAQEKEPQQAYIALPPLQAPIMQAGRIYRQLRVMVQIETASGKQEQRAQDMLPRLQRAFQSALLDIAKRRLRPRKAPDIAFIAEQLQMEADRILGPDFAKVRVDNVSVIR